MSEFFSDYTSHESDKDDDAPKNTPPKRNKSPEAKPRAEENKPEKKLPLPLDRLFERHDEKKEDTEGLTSKPELTSAEASEALGRIADVRELEIGAAELNDANDDAAETAEAVAAVELLQNVKSGAEQKGFNIDEVLLAAEQRTIEALGLANGADTGKEQEGNASKVASAGTETIINTDEPGEAEIMFAKRPEADTDTNSKRQKTPPARAEYVYYESNAAGAMLLGGIIGHLSAKRRGRGKAEKRLLPVQKKLEREVGDIHERLIDSEMRIRRMAAEKVRTMHRIERRPTERGATPPERKSITRAESRLTVQKPASAERLGKVLMRAETAGPGESVPKLRDMTPERVRTLNRRELLLLSEKIIVEGSSLRQVYESHLIGERGLRRLIIEHLRGKDIRKSLRREMIEREIDFERDPILRDKAYQEAAKRSDAQTLQQLLQTAGIDVGGEDVLPGAVQQARYEAAMRKATQRRRMADTAMITVIVVLATLVTMLLLER